MFLPMGEATIRIKENPAADASGCRISVCPQMGQDMKKSGEILIFPRILILINMQIFLQNMLSDLQS